MADDRAARRFFVLLLAATTLTLALVVRPLASALFIAAVLAAIMAPLHVRMTSPVGRWFRDLAVRLTPASVNDRVLRRILTDMPGVPLESDQML